MVQLLEKLLRNQFFGHLLLHVSSPLRTTAPDFINSAAMSDFGADLAGWESWESTGASRLATACLLVDRGTFPDRFCAHRHRNMGESL